MNIYVYVKHSPGWITVNKFIMKNKCLQNIPGTCNYLVNLNGNSLRFTKKFPGSFEVTCSYGKFIYWYPSWCMLPIYFFLKQETIDRCKSIVYISCHCYRSTKDSFLTNIKTKFRQTDKLFKFVSDVLWKRSLVSSLNLGPNYGRRGLAQDCPGLIREDWECLVFFSKERLWLHIHVLIPFLNDNSYSHL